MMKKLTAVLLALLMMLSCAVAETVDFSGAWYLVKASAQGMELDPSVLGMEMVLDLKADGSAELRMTGEETDSGATWVANDNGVVVTDSTGDAMALVYTGDQLVMEMDDVGMYFAREAAAAPAAEGGDYVADAVIDDFQGSWNGVAVEMMGMEMPLDAMDATASVKVDGLKVRFDMDGDAIDLEGTIADGILTVMGPEDTPMVFKIKTDGRLACEMSVEGMTASFVFEKAE